MTTITIGYHDLRDSRGSRDHGAMSLTITTQDAWIPSEDRFGTRLAMVRQRMGWNLKQAADECGLAMNAWARYENGNTPRELVEVVRKISRRTGVDRTWLMWGERPEQDSNLQPTDYKAVVPSWAKPVRLPTAARKRTLSRPPVRSDSSRPNQSHRGR